MSDQFTFKINDKYWNAKVNGIPQHRRGLTLTYKSKVLLKDTLLIYSIK